MNQNVENREQEAIKATYSTPEIEVIEMELEGAILNDSGGTGDNFVNGGRSGRSRSSR